MKTEKELLELAKKDGWITISYKQKLSEAFIEKYKDNVDWHNISINQKLSEEFIEKYNYKVDWKCISIYKKLSEKFIEKHKDKIDWIGLLKNKKIKLSDKFIIKYKLLGYIN